MRGTRRKVDNRDDGWSGTFSLQAVVKDEFLVNFDLKYLRKLKSGSYLERKAG